MKIRPADRTKNIVYAIRNIVSYAKKLESEGHKITYLNIGDPIPCGFQTPMHMVEAVYDSMKKGMNGYAHSYGNEESRIAISEDENRKGKKDISPEDILITTGASEAIEIVLTALLNEGDSVLLPVPGYPLYDAVVSKIGADSRGYFLDFNNSWQPDLKSIESLVDKKTKAIVLINPNNPTGAVYSRETIEGIVDICRQNNMIILSDEIYDKMLFDDNQMCYPSSISEDVPVVSFNGLSKNYLAPGWRMGWMIFQNMDGEKEFISAVRRIAEARLCSPSMVQGAIVPALRGDQSHI